MHQPKHTADVIDTVAEREKFYDEDYSLPEDASTQEKRCYDNRAAFRKRAAQAYRGFKKKQGGGTAHDHR